MKDLQLLYCMTYKRLEQLLNLKEGQIWDSGITFTGTEKFNDVHVSLKLIDHLAIYVTTDEKNADYILHINFMSKRDDDYNAYTVYTGKSSNHTLVECYQSAERIAHLMGA